MLGVVLAGGRSRRMGRDKAEVEVAGRSMMSWVVAALEAVCDRVLIAGREDGWEGRAGLIDPPGGHGPLAGLAAALEIGEPLLLVAVDQPWVRSATLRQLAETGTTAVPIDGDTRQVTCARYDPDLLPIARSELKTGGSLQTLLDRVTPLEITEGVWRQWGEDGRSWFSVDQPADIEEGLRRFGSPGEDQSGP
jgi:molybdopterin-guanine dinucleotide biosynthesis protein A